MGQIQYKFNKNDEYYTPTYAVYPIMEELAKGSIVWCPFDKKESNYVKILEENGFKVIFGHIETGQDFFNTEVPKCDYIISNPPYSVKGDVFKYLFELKIPFAMLINMQGIFDHKERFKMFKENRVEILWLSPRVNYIKLNQDMPSGVPFQSAYLCSGILDRELNYKFLNKNL